MQILILGMHRSGTSATARLINMMGAYFGPEGTAPELTIANPKGFWERFDVYTLNDAFLKAKKCGWHNLQHWDFTQAAATPPNIAHSIQNIIAKMDAFRPWFLKDPRLCLLLPAWKRFLEVPVAVIVYRDPLEIAISLEKRDKLPIPYGLALWEYYAVGLLNASRDMPRIFVRHRDLLERPVKTCEALYHALVAQEVRRLAMPGAREIRAFIDPKLYRSKIPENIGILLSPAQILLTELLQGRSREGNVQVSEASCAAMRAGVPTSFAPPI